MIIYAGNDGSRYWRSTDSVPEHPVTTIKGDRVHTLTERDAESLREWLNARKAEKEALK